MRILVTGSKGYCGFGVVNALTACGYEVIGFDRSYPEGYHPSDNYRIILGDITNFPSIVKALEGVDGIIHSAIYTGREVPENLPQPLLPETKIEYQNINAFEVTDLGSLYLFEAARQMAIKRLCLISSGAIIYHHIIDHKDQTILPPVKVFSDSKPALRGFYGLTKYIQEEIGRFYAEQYAMSVSSMRAWWVVDGNNFINKIGENLHKDSHPLSPEGLVDRVDLGHACRLAIEKKLPGFHVYYPMSGPGSDTFFDVKPLEELLGWQPEYRFEALKK